ncbi:hypothetical protein EAF04_000677 [Stromatinia cepivora]|nr:hypothetical protein EAF04_000677 [Stromatinia cepivora]
MPAIHVRYGKNYIPVLSKQETIEKLTVIIGINETLSEHLELQYRSVLKYAQSFERIESFKRNMGVPAWKQFVYGPQNAFQNPHKHSIENWLEEARAQSEKKNYNVEKFRTIRCSIIDYLELQYQKISTSGSILNNFIKRNKQVYGTFDLRFRQNIASRYGYNEVREIYAEAVLLLEDYLISFDRDVPYSIRIYIKSMGVEYSDLLDTLPRNCAFRIICQSYKNFPDDPNARFVANFRKLVDDCDKQWLEIRKARKELFQWDNVEIEPEFNLELVRCDEMVKWDIREPTLMPERPR